MTGDALAFHDIAKLYVGKDRVVEAVTEIDFEVAGGSFVSIVGPSGCGKSTLLKMVAGLVVPTEGTIHQAGRVLPPEPNTRVGYIPQHDNLLPWRTALGNVTFPLECRGIPKSDRLHMAREVLELVGLTGFEGAYPAQLSGGMRKRVSIARTLSYRPRVMLADEPFGALDAQLKAVMGAEFQRIWSEIWSTVLFVTHDLLEAIILSDRVIVMSSRPGRVVADCRVDLPRPRDVMNARFDPQVADLHGQLWSILEDDIRRGEAM